MSMKTMACCHPGRLTQMAEATVAVRASTPCHTPPAGRLSERLVVSSRLHSAKPSFARAVRISSGAATHPRCGSIHVIRP